MQLSEKIVNGKKMLVATQPKTKLNKARTKKDDYIAFVSSFLIKKCRYISVDSYDNVKWQVVRAKTPNGVKEVEVASFNAIDKQGNNRVLSFAHAPAKHIFYSANKINRV